MISGAVDPDQALDLVRRDFARMPAGTRVTSPAPAHDQTKARFELVENVSSQTELRVSFRAVPDRLEDRATMNMLMRLVDDGMSTRLYHRICDDKGLCYDVSASYDGYEDDGVLDFAAGCQHARAPRITTEILALVTELARTGPTAEELDKARRRHGWDLRAMLDSPEDIADFYATSLLFDRFLTPEETRAMHAAVTPGMIQELAKLLAQPSRLNVLAVGDGDDKRLADVVKRFQAA